MLTLNPQAGLATLWRAADGARLQSIPQANVRDALFADQDRTLVTSGNGEARLWRWDGRRYVLKAHLEGNQNAIPAMAASADGRYAATCSFDGTVHLWNARTGALVNALSVGPTNTCFAVRFSPDARTLATGDERLARLWRLPDLRPLQMLSSIARPVIHLAYAPDGRLGQ